MKSIRQLKNIKGKRVLVRVDFNVPIKNGKILDTSRIDKAMPTLKYLIKKGARLILISHLGENGKQSLKPVADYLKKFIKKDITLLENIRRFSGEMKNDSKFAKQLASLGDLYVNEAFSVSHRAHASIVGPPKYLPSYAGLQLEKEIKNLEAAFKKPKHPFLFILGGAKFSTKIPLIKKFLGRASMDGARHDSAESADAVFVGGALMNNFFKEAGVDIGKSVYEKKNFGLKKLSKNPKIILPPDVIVYQNSFVDVGPYSVKLLEELIKKSKFILMNGPLGNYEKGFGKATEKILKAIIKSRAKVIIGGGDTVSLLSNLEPRTYNLKPNLFVSTGGGAMLEFLEKGTLPGIEALRVRSKE